MNEVISSASEQKRSRKMDLNASISREILEDIQAGLIIGASAYVEKDGKTLCRQTLGMADLTPLPVQLTENHLFRLASMTKPVIAVCILLQVERGKLSLKDEVAKYLPEFSDMQVVELDEQGECKGYHPAPRNITIADLLTHTSGLGSGVWFALHYPDSQLTEEATLADRMSTLASSPLEFDPGTAFSYSATAGFDVLARLVEMTSGMSIEDYLQQNLCQPLGMKDTTFNPTPEQMERLVIMHASTPEGPRKVHSGNHIFETQPRSYHCGGAGLVSSLADYILFARMLLNEGQICKVDEQEIAQKVKLEETQDAAQGCLKENSPAAGSQARLLFPESIRQMQTPWVQDLPGLGQGCAWGLSVRVVTEDQASQKPLQKGSFGWSGAYGTHFWIDPVHRLFAVYMSNMSTAGGAGAKTARHLERDVMEALQNEEESPKGSAIGTKKGPEGSAINTKKEGTEGSAW